MALKDLIKRVSVIDTLPIEIDFIIDIMRREHGVNDQIYYFKDASLDTKSLRGFICREEIPSLEGPYMMSTITYGEMDDHMERFVCGKELTHILDHEATKVASSSAISKLIEKIVLPPELVDPFSDGLHANSDRIGFAQALALLFPLAARDVLSDMSRAR